MRRILKAVFAFLAVATVSFTINAPALATTVDDLTYTFDCFQVNDGVFPVPHGHPISIELANCHVSYIADITNDPAAGTGLASINNVVIDNTKTVIINNPSVTLTVGGDAVIGLFYSVGDSNSQFARIETYEPQLLENPEGSKLVDSTATFPVTPNEFSITTGETDSGGDILLNGNETCDLEPGSHSYVAKRFHVTTAGKYTFRFLGTNPAPVSIDPSQESTALQDSMVAMYSGVAGCNDDINDYNNLNGVDWTNVNYGMGITESGDLFPDQFSYFEDTLQPGDYTFVFTTYSAYSASDWASGNDWTPGEITIDYDVWGPTAGLTEVDHFALASTGFDATFGLWTALGLAATGGAIAIVRRRAVARL